MNAKTALFPGLFSVKSLLRQFLVLLTICWMYGFVNAQEPRQKIPPRKATIINKANHPFQNNARSNNTLCDFTLTPVNASTNPLSQIIQSLVGSGITISNIQSNLPLTSEIYGSFSCGSAANLGMESGLLLTTGVVSNAKGPNISSSTSMDNFLPGSSLLDPLTGGGDGYDATVVSFNISSNTNTITFQYVFASEEYNEYVNAGYNDVFGFFISGPGITGSQNIAVLPNTTTPVTIDNINNGLNSQYYLDNETQLVGDPVRFANIEYDGLTVVLTATATVVPGSTYTLTLAIEDVGDGVYDSGVFIKGGSITSGAPTITCPSNKIADAPPGACAAIVTGIDPTVTPQGTAYDYMLSGATTGTGNGTASGQTFNGGTTTVTYKITNAPTVSCSFTVTVNTNVVPSVSIAANPGNTICAGTNVTFTATPTNGGTPSYQWKLNGNNVGTNSNSYQNTGLVNGDVVTVVMTSSLACANPTTATSNGITMVVTGPVTPSVSIAANPGNTICGGTNVTFTATPTNGGTPSYQWKLNGNNVGTNINTYQSAGLLNGDVVTVVMTSSLACANPTTATSNGITMVVTGTVIPSVSIAADPGNTICAGLNVIFTATPTNGGTPSYQWKLNGNNVGTNSNTYSNNGLANGDVVTVVMTSSLACASPATATSNAITMAITGSVAPSVTITANPGNTICAGINVTFTATPTNGGTPSYQWKLNGNNVGTNSNTYSNNSLVNGDVVTVVMTSSLACASPATATSNGITMVVTSSVAPSVNIAADPGNAICAGLNVTFTATPTNGGTPSYQWKLNGNNVGTNSNTYSNNTLLNGDVVTVVMTSSLACASPATATSNAITMAITGSVAPSVTIAANPGNTICTGTNVTFTATPTNGGTPSYQWKLNGNNVGTNSNTYSNNVLANGDVVTVVMTSSLACASPTTASSNAITMTVNPNVISGTVSGGSPLCIGQTSPYTSNGTAGGSWSSSNTSVATVNSTTGLVTALSAGTTDIVYSVIGNCGTVNASRMLTVNPNVSAGVVTGLTPLSSGATTLYSSTGTSGGTWSSTNSGVATVNGSTGLVTAVSAGTTNITYTVNNGCGSPVSASQTLTVTSGGGIVHCGPKNDKILICHNGSEICVAPAAVAAHLAHGDIQGHCPTSTRIVISKNEQEKKLLVTAYPNPYETVLKLNINSPVSGTATIEFFNINGVRIYEVKQYLVAGKSIVTDVKSLSSFKAGIIYKVTIGKYQTNGILLRPSK